MRSREQEFRRGPAGRWRGATVVVAASGPSLTEEDVAHVKGRAKVIVINATFRLAPWADVLYAADYPFWRTYVDEIRAKFRGEWWSVSERAREEFGSYWIRHSGDRGLSKHSDTINGGGNSGYQGVHLAATFGASRILLLGFDMQNTDGRYHWHGRHKGKLPNGTGYENWIGNFKFLAKDLKSAGIETINCTRQTALLYFPRSTIQETLP
jgi:hypothetical protein